MSGKWCGGDAAGDEIEAGVLEGQRLGVRARRLHVGEALGLGELGRLLQHLGREVAGDRAGHVGRERRRRVPGAGGDVERLPGRLRLHQLDQPAEAGALGVHGRRGIGRGMRAELLLDEGFVHGLHLPLPTTWSQANMARGANPMAENARPPYSLSPPPSDATGMKGTAALLGHLAAMVSAGSPASAAAPRDWARSCGPRSLAAAGVS